MAQQFPNPADSHRFSLSPHALNGSVAAWSAKVVCGCAALAIAASLVVMIGWWTNVPVLRSLGPHLAPTKFNTALAFLMLGGALWALHPDPTSAQHRRIGAVLGSVAFLIALLTSVEHLSGLDFGIDELFASAAGMVARSGKVGRMSLDTAGALMATSLAIFFLATERIWLVRLAQWLGLTVSFVGFIELLGYVFEIDATTPFSPFSTTTLPTGLLLITLGAGIMLARPREGFVTVYCSSGIGGRMFRRLLAPAIVVIVVVAWLRLQGERFELYGAEVGLALFTTFNVVALSLTAWFAARHVDRLYGQLRERALADARSAAIVESSLDAIVGKDLQGVVTHWNPGAVAIFGYQSDEMLGQPMRRLIPLERQNEEDEILEKIGRGERVMQFDSVRRHRDGRLIDVSITVSPIRNSAGVVVGASTIVRDVTARRAAERALRESEERFATTFRSSPVAIAIFRRDDGTLFDVNETFLRTFGYDREDVLGRNSAQLGMTTEEEMRAIREEVLASPRLLNRERILRASTGAKRSLLVSNEMITVGGISCTLTTMVDVTERKQAVEALESHRGMLEETGRIAKVGGWTFDVATGRGIWTDETARIHDLDPLTPPSRETGVDFYTETSKPLIKAAVQAAIEEAKPYDLELELISAKGVHKWVRTIGRPVVEHGKVVRVVGSFQDITDQRQQASLVLRAQRMEAIGTLASGVAHDLNNILAPVLMLTGLLRDELKGKPAALQSVDLIESSARRGAAIIRQLLTFGRGQGGEEVVVPIRHLLKELGEFATETFPRTIGVKTGIPVDLGSVRGDPTQLHQVLLNLCVNARDAMRMGGTLTIGGQNATLTTEQIPAPVNLPPGEYVVIIVQDTGEGIPPEVMDRIFDPFFTTKAVGEGSGLGLSTVQNIVRAHRGFVTVDSEQGHGTTFKVHLPAADGEAVAVATAPPQERAKNPAEGNQELILLVDDEAPVREATSYVLTNQNYRVVVASNGREAISRYLQNQDAVRLVITDVMMPVMGGVELARAIQAMDQALPIIAVSGFSDAGKLAELAKYGVTEVLAKPITPEDLLAKVRMKLRVKG